MEKSEINPGTRSGLQIAQKEAEKRINAQIQKGFKLLARDINSLTDLDDLPPRARQNLIFDLC